MIGDHPLWLPAVTAVITRADGHVLLVKRSDNGAWTPVTGIVDPGEEPAVAAAREALEETGVRVRVDRLAATGAHPEIVHENGDRAAYLDLTFACTWLDGEARVADEESTDVRWWPLDALPAMSELMADPHRSRPQRRARGPLRRTSRPARAGGGAGPRPPGAGGGRVLRRVGGRRARPRPPGQRLRGTDDRGAGGTGAGDARRGGRRDRHPDRPTGQQRSRRRTPRPVGCWSASRPRSSPPPSAPRSRPTPTPRGGRPTSLPPAVAPASAPRRTPCARRCCRSTRGSARDPASP